jgi:hypothetical protein
MRESDYIKTMLVLLFRNTLLRIREILGKAQNGVNKGT